MAFKLGYCTLRWRNPDLEPALEALKKAGWDGWECRLPLDWLGPPSRIRKICEAVGLPMAIYTAQGSPEVDDPEHHERNKRRIDYAAEMEVDCFMYMSGRKPEGRAVNDDDVKNAAEAADAWADYASQYGLELSYHIHTNTLVDSAEHWTLYMKHLHKARLCIDVSHGHLWGYDAGQSLRDFKDQLNYVHLQDYSDCTRGEDGRYEPSWVSVGQAEALDFPSFPDILEDIGFDRWVTGCPGAPVPGAEDPMSEAKRSEKMYRYMRDSGY